MKVIRFVGIGELESLVKNGNIEPLHCVWHGGYWTGNKKAKPVLWFFPFASDEDVRLNRKPYVSYRELAHGLDSPLDRLRYVSGVVDDVQVAEGDNIRYVSICLHLNLPRKLLVRDSIEYADPEGAFFDRTLVDEFLLYSPYSTSAVRGVELYYTYETTPSKALIGSFRKPSEALNYLTSRTKVIKRPRD